MDYTLIRSRRKTLAIQVKPDLTVVVRAPQRTSLKAIDAFVAKQADWLSRALARQQASLLAHPEPDAQALAALKAQAAAHIPERVAHFAALMGLEPRGVKITAARTRFGSCSGKNSFCFSCRLMEYPSVAIDYVVVHELAHIVHKNHGKDFYALVAAYLPDWQSRRTLLRT